MDWLYEVPPSDKTLFLEPLQRIGERARTHTAERIFQFTKSVGLFHKITHDEEGTRIAEKVDNTRDRTICAEFLSLALCS